MRTVEECVERLKATGSVLPEKPGVKPGTVIRTKRKTTAWADNRVRPTIKKNRGGINEYTVLMCQDDVGGSMKKIHRTNVNRRINRKDNKTTGPKNGFTARKPRRKEQYSRKSRLSRQAWARKYEKWQKQQWRKMVFLDEHGMTCPSHKTGSRQLHAAKKRVWLEEGDNPLDNEFVAPKEGKGVMGGTPVKMQFAILDDEFIVNELCSFYSSRSEPPKPPPPKLTKSGKTLGRPRKPVVQKDIKRRNYDDAAHALFLEEMHAIASIKLNLDKNGGEIQVIHLRVYQDGLPLHRAPLSKKTAQKLKMVIHGPPSCGYSPDTNPIENLFGILDARLLELQKKKRCKNKTEWVERVRKVAKEMGLDGTVRKTIDTMEERCAALIAAKGGPTDY